jgi:predicted nucleic acid-binding protein
VSYLLDTNILSEIRKGDAAHAAVRAWFSGLAAEDVYVSVLTLGEIHRGVERVRLRGDHGQAHRLDAWLVRLETVYAGRILPVDVRVADLWGRLQVPDPLPVVDALLAATAIVHGLTLVTRNVSDVQRTAARVLDPFASSL